MVVRSILPFCRNKDFKHRRRIAARPLALGPTFAPRSASIGPQENGPQTTISPRHEAHPIGPKRWAQDVWLASQNATQLLEAVRREVEIQIQKLEASAGL